MADAECTSPARTPGPRESQRSLLPLLRIPLACSGVGACLGACAAIMILAPGLLMDGDLGEEFSRAGAVALSAFYVLGVGAPAGALLGGLLGLLISPLALLLKEREDLFTILFRTTLLGLPSTVVFGLGESIPTSAVGVGLTAVGLFCVQLWVPRRGLRVLGISIVLVLGPVFMAPTIRARHFLPDTVPALMGVMQTDDSGLCGRACRRLIEVAGVEGLLTALRHPDSRVRLEAARQIQHFPSERVRVALEAALEQALEEEDLPLENITRHALRTVGG